MQNVPEQELRQSVATSDMYQLLSLFCRLPTEELVKGLSDGSLANDVLAILGELDVEAIQIKNIKDRLVSIENNVQDKNDLLSELRQEYTRLFSHPKRPVIDIYETMFLYRSHEDTQEKPSLFISPAALDAERCYKNAGLKMQGTEPGDHLSIEMEFMAYLHLEKAKALRDGNAECFARRQAEIQEFRELHLQRWAADFFETCTSLAQNDTYRLLGLVGSNSLKKMLG